MTTKHDGGAAFPIPHSNEPGAYEAETGMSLRDWFAGQALAGIFAGGFADTVPHDDVSNGTASSPVACFAYLYADAMLAARSAK